MARKNGGNSRNRGIQPGVRKRKLRRTKKREGETVQDVAAVFAWINRRKLARFTELMVVYSVWAAYTLACVQFGAEKGSSSGGKKYVRASIKRRACHYIITTLLFISVVHKFVVSAVRFNEEARPGVETLMCMSLFMIQFVGWAMSLGLVFRWQESIEILNTWDRLVAAIDETGQRSPFDDVPAALKIILCVSIAIGCGAGNAIVSLLFSNLPVCFYPMCKAAGLLPELSFMTPLMWQLAFFPAELTLGVLAMCNGNLGGVMLNGSICVQKVCMATLK